jgi:hypothetical protein
VRMHLAKARVKLPVVSVPATDVGLWPLVIEAVPGVELLPPARVVPAALLWTEELVLPQAVADKVTAARAAARTAPRLRRWTALRGIADSVGVVGMSRSLSPRRTLSCFVVRGGWLRGCNTVTVLQPVSSHPGYWGCLNS